MLLSLFFAYGSFNTIKPTTITTTTIQPMRAATAKAKLEAKLPKTDAKRVEKIRFRLLNKIEIEGRPELDWDGRFPVGPIEDYKRRVDKGHDEENRNVIVSKLGNYFLPKIYFSLRPFI